jgi:hypothetical protein
MIEMILNMKYSMGKIITELNAHLEVVNLISGLLVHLRILNYQLLMKPTTAPRVWDLLLNQR